MRRLLIRRFRGARRRRRVVRLTVRLRLWYVFKLTGRLPEAIGSHAIRAPEVVGVRQWRVREASRPRGELVCHEIQYTETEIPLQHRRKHRKHDVTKEVKQYLNEERKSLNVLRRDIFLTHPCVSKDSGETTVRCSNHLRGLALSPQWPALTS